MMLLILGLSSLLLIVRADTSVHILSSKFKNPMTSSTLNWVPESHYSSLKNFVIGAFENIKSPDGSAERTQRPVFVCRALHNGIWVAGARKDTESRCAVSLPGNVGSYERYQLLENVESAGRLSWTNWTKNYEPPDGAVSSSDKKLFVARHIGHGSLTHFIGTLNAQDTLGSINFAEEDGREGSQESGQVLVETEPTAYELAALKLNDARSRIVRKTLRELARTTISNTGVTPATLAEAITYTYQYALYWGQGHAMLKGLNTSITLQNKTRLPDINWGIEVREDRVDAFIVEVRLEPGTAVNVTLRGLQATVEVSYNGKLTSHYADGAHIQPRLIAGERREDSLLQVAPEFGPVFFLSNSSLVPTTPALASTKSLTTPMTPSPQPISTSPTTRQQLQQTERFDLADSVSEERYGGNALDENTGRRVDEGQGTDGGPLSLKENGTPAAAPGFWLLLLLLLLPLRAT